MKKLTAIITYFIISGFAIIHNPVTIDPIPDLTVVSEARGSTESGDHNIITEMSGDIPNIYPMTNHHHVTSKYGYRTDPISGGRKFHDGIDYRCPIGTPLIATIDGTMYGYMDKHGAKVVILKNKEYTVTYAHLSDRVFRLKVKKGDVIGYSGNTGRTTGPHLHYSVYENNQMGISSKPIDPKTLLISPVEV